VHDGVSLYSAAAGRLLLWQGEGRGVVLITNAPRTAQAVEQQLARIGLPRECWDAITTSGEAGIEALEALDKPVGFVGTPGDREILEGRGVRIAEGDTFTDLACTGLEEMRPHVEDYRPDLELWADRDVHMHCLNPDRLVIRGGLPEACAGAIADVYQGLGGRVTWYGKPHEAIYRHALQHAGNPPADEVLVIGDALQTDALGAARMGFDFVFVQGGIHAGEPFPEDFAAQNGLGEWQPVAVVGGLD
jgi:HAD superfamily hydrolase (TIGR01459 family)